MGATSPEGKLLKGPDANGSPTRSAAGDARGGGKKRRGSTKVGGELANMANGGGHPNSDANGAMFLALHHCQITQMCLSPDGSTIVSASADGTIFVSHLRLRGGGRVELHGVAEARGPGISTTGDEDMILAELPKVWQNGQTMVDLTNSLQEVQERAAFEAATAEAEHEKQMSELEATRSAQIREGKRAIEAMNSSAVVVTQDWEEKMRGTIRPPHLTGPTTLD